MGKITRTAIGVLVAIGTTGLCFALVRPRFPEIPAATTAPDIIQVASAVNHELLSGSDGASLPAAPSAGLAHSLLVCRRLSLALTGTIPSLEEIRRLQALRPEERASTHLESLLTDRRYADYMAERLARALVDSDGGPFLVYRRRRFVDWLSDQLAANRPYDVIIRHVLTDSGLWTEKPATNFFTAAMREGDSRPDVNQLTIRVCRGMLGIRLDCAQCHDHPFDPSWKQADFQQLAAFFTSTGLGPGLTALRGIEDELTPLASASPGQETTSNTAPRVPFAPELIAQDGPPRDRLASWLVNPRNPAFARAAVNRWWNYLMGRPLWSPVDDVPLELDPADPGARALSLLADDFARHGFDLHRLVRIIASTRAFQAESRMLADDGKTPSPDDRLTSWDAFPITPLRGEQVVGSVLQVGSLRTIDYGSPLFARLLRYVREAEFVDRYGDRGGRELETEMGTIPQCLLLMNGQTVHDALEANPLTTAVGRLALLAPDDATALETAFLTVLTRLPTATERDYFIPQIETPNNTVEQRAERLSDIAWALVNSTEFTWNH